MQLLKKKMYIVFKINDINNNNINNNKLYLYKIYDDNITTLCMPLVHSISELQVFIPFLEYGDVYYMEEKYILSTAKLQKNMFEVHIFQICEISPKIVV